MFPLLGAGEPGGFTGNGTKKNLWFGVVARDGGAKVGVVRFEIQGIRFMMHLT